MQYNDVFTPDTADNTDCFQHIKLYRYIQWFYRLLILIKLSIFARPHANQKTFEIKFPTCIVQYQLTSIG